MSLRERLDNDMKAAMKERDALRLSVIRMVKSEIRNEEIAKGTTLQDEDVLQVLSRQAKRRRESIEQYGKGGRTDLVEQEAAELRILSEYMPEQMDEAEIARVAREVISELHAASRADKGKVMGAVMPRVRGKADGKLVNQVVDRLLESGSV